MVKLSGVYMYTTLRRLKINKPVGKRIYYHLPNIVLVSLTSIFTIHNKTIAEFLVVHYLCPYIFDNTCMMIIRRIIKMSKKALPLASFYV